MRLEMSDIEIVDTALNMGGKYKIFTPPFVDGGEYIVWAHALYPNSYFVPTSCLRAGTLMSAVSNYLQLLWKHRNWTRGELILEMTNLQKEVVLLRRTEVDVLNFKKALRNLGVIYEA